MFLFASLGVLLWFATKINNPRAKLFAIPDAPIASMLEASHSKYHRRVAAHTLLLGATDGLKVANKVLLIEILKEILAEPGGDGFIRWRSAAILFSVYSGSRYFSSQRKQGKSSTVVGDMLLDRFEQGSLESQPFSRFKIQKGCGIIEASGEPSARQSMRQRIVQCMLPICADDGWKFMGQQKDFVVHPISGKSNSNDDPFEVDEASYKTAYGMLVKLVCNCRSILIAQQSIEAISRIISNAYFDSGDSSPLASTFEESAAARYSLLTCVLQSMQSPCISRRNFAKSTYFVRSYLCNLFAESEPRQKDSFVAFLKSEAVLSRQLGDTLVESICKATAMRVRKKRKFSAADLSFPFLFQCCVIRILRCRAL